MEQEFEYKGHDIKIVQEQSPESPRTANDNVGTMTCFHSRYTLGDKHEYSSLEEFLEGETGLYSSDQTWEEGEDGDYYCKLVGNEVVSEKEWVKTLLEKWQTGKVVLPLYLYDHSGITMNTSGFSCRWDSGQVGFIWCTEEKAIDEWGEEWPEKAEAYLKGEVETYDQYLTGEVYGYEIDGGEDSCWGYYGDPETSGCIEDAKASVDSMIETVKA